MGEQTANTMNLDLNLGPSPSPDNDVQALGALSNESVNLEDWIDGRVNHVNRLRENLRLRPRQRWRYMRRQLPVPAETRTIALDLMVSSTDAVGVTLQTGEGSISPEERNGEKTCENNVTHEENEQFGKKEDEGKINSEDGSFFDCNICLELARDPVVTCCGHLFCWPCIYRWLNVHSDAKECPVCKGEVTVKNVTPIYGRGTNTRDAEEDPNLKIPLRPNARRVESWRQTIQRNASPVEEMMRRFVNTENNNNSLLNRILTSRGMRGEQSTVVPPEDVVDVDLTQNIPTNAEAAERLESYFRYHPAERNEEQPLAVDDRDSVSSIAAVIHSESQTVDTAVEIDSRVSVSTSSSRRRNDASRVSDVDSGDSRPHRRRRLN
ncbi:hypothetical protein Vadar_006361 [Vaccinium darrowii]|uniref:Uncharacterized protein n=1 Tax=Vaccinium darrowii TaxID=229202 RepID=A0ACB7XPY8_9ERIC|nr:hypothetical protein Vadar_006361 [Vaccinium darrowii]